MDGALSRPRRRISRSIAALTEREAAERIAADDLDILVDLSTHTARRQAGHPRAEAGARADHARRERRHGRAVGDRLQAHRRLCRSAGEPGGSSSRRCCRWMAASIPYRHVAPARRASVSSRPARHRRRTRSSSARSSVRSSCRAAALRCGATCSSASPGGARRFAAVVPRCVRAITRLVAAARHRARSA